MLNAPASWSARASSRSSWASCLRFPCSLYPPSLRYLWGVRPICPITGIPALTIAFTRSAYSVPPSSFTASAPALTKATADSTAFEVLGSYVPKGMSPTIIADGSARATAIVWRIISSRLTVWVDFIPRTTIPRLSPTSMMSTPASSTIKALG